jgi:catechol 2,3-dioxygenase-like lactoylglutathione lyase family enzyme
MKIEHIGLWVKGLEKMREFYNRYFDSVSNEI